MSIIKIKRSGNTAQPNTGLGQGELAYSYLPGTLANGGDRLYIGTGTETNGVAANIDVIGGKYFTEKLDHTPGTLTANSAVIVDTDLRVDQFLVDQIHIDGSTIRVNSNTSLADANTNLYFQAGTNGDIVFNSTVTYTEAVDFDAQVTVSSINVEDLSNTRVVYVGTSGELVDDAGFRYTGSGANTGVLYVDGTIDVGVQANLASAKVEDLTATRVTYAGTGGELVDDSGFTYTGSGATGVLTITNKIDVNTQADLASAKVEDLTATRITYAGTGGELVDDAGLTYTGTGNTGTLQLLGSINVDVEATLASAVVEDLTDNRIVIAGTGGAIEDDSNFTFDGTTFKVGTTTNDKFRVAVSTGNVDTTGNIEADGTLGADGNFRIGTGGANTFTVAAGTGNTLTAGTVGIEGNTAIGANTSARVWTIDSSNGDITHTGVQTTTGQLNVDELRLDGNTISSTDTDGNIYLDPNGDGYVQVVGTNGLVIPVGNTAQQGPQVAGSIRFNSEINQFEGYSGANWASLGGVRSVDGLTYIIAESSPGSSDDTIYFYTADSNTTNIQAATLTSTTLTLNQNTSSTSTTTGSLVVTGGVGVSENVNVGGDVDIDGDLNVDGGDITTNLTAFNLLNTTATTVNAFGAATQINIGTGGEGVGNTSIDTDVNISGDFKVGANSFHVDASTGDVLVGNDLTITGDLVVNGNTTSINVSTLEVEDALIFLAANNTVSDSVDIGIAGQYFDATANTVMLTGIFRDSGTDEWYLFDEYSDAVNNADNNNIDISSNTFSKGVLNTDAVKFSNTTIQLSGDVAGSITIDQMGGGDGGSNTVYTITTTVQADSVALGTDTTGDYVQSISANTATGVSVTGTGEGATVVVAGVIATHSGQLGVATFDSLSNGAGSNRNFDVSNTGSVSINTIDGGTY